VTIVDPFPLAEDTDAKATDVQGKWDALREAVEGIGVASTAADVYQAGVVTSTDWVVSGKESTTAGTGAITLTTGGSAWLPGPSGGLVRIFNTSAEVLKAIKPASLPASGGYMSIGFELTASGPEAVVSLVSGVEKSTAAEALAAPAAVTAGKVRIYDLILHNTAGSYSNTTGMDRRPWARGASTLVQRTSGTITLTTSSAEPAGIAQRMECSGVPLVLHFEGMAVVSETTGALVSFHQDGVQIGSLGDTAGAGAGQYTIPATGQGSPFALSARFSPSAGSHLFSVAVKREASGEASLLSSAAKPLYFSVEELRPSANNGNS